MYIQRVFGLFKKINAFYIKITSFIILSFIYFIGIGLTSLVGKLFKQDFLIINKSNNKSNWCKYYLSENMEKMY